MTAEGKFIFVLEPSYNRSLFTVFFFLMTLKYSCLTVALACQTLEPVVTDG